ncbi:hypothetical protein QR680_008602 [Steinernema hermaphroditum]|uniref:Uncharacterized protein n=1 Tax=Steinernema hermaphroditum TaxID=289476 RepID=A0AA39IJF7_9BILA|nr:hypothetical protein QR680_008602 [Steinernema hermaphroditum]
MRNLTTKLLTNSIEVFDPRGVRSDCRPPMNPLLRALLLLVAAVVVLASSAALPSAASEELLSKRSNWQKANGLWGKRAVADDGLSMWKRPDDWTKLNSLWGKRSSWSTANGLWGKRASWQTANGLWGKRSAPVMDYGDQALY